MDDLTSEFLVETNESLEALDLDFVELEKNPDDMEIINNIFRVMHTIKGTCGFLGLQRLEHVAHAAENIMDKLRDKAFPVTPDIVSLILEANDRIKFLIEHLEEHEEEPEGDDTDLVDRLNQCAESGSTGDGAPSAATEATAEETTSEPLSEQEISEEQVNKTPDLDEPIDFEPVPMPETIGKEGGEEAPKEEVPAVMPDDTPAAALKLSDEQQEKAVKTGLETAKEDGAPKKKTATAGQSIRVNIDILEHLMQMVGELVLTRNQLLQMVRNSSNNEFNAPLQRLNHITTELQEGVMQTRMQPIGNAWAKFPRLIRDLSLELDKKIELKMIGADTELDRQMLEAIKDPLTHMVRNSADHGIEPSAQRKETGKSEIGTVTLSAYHEGGHIIIKISDDGRGLNVEKIAAKAIENGLTTQDQLAGMSKKQIYQFVFRPGFSTAEKITAVSGRGVGMDVVVSNIEKIGGHVELDSWEGRGSEFMITLPLTLAIMPVLIVESCSETFAIPQIRVSEIVRVDEIHQNSAHRIEKINDVPVLRIRGRLLPLISVSETLQLVREQLADNDNEKSTGKEAYIAEPYIVICEIGSQSVGLLVDQVFHTEEIVVKPIAAIMKNLEVYSGCTILGDGSVIMILDPNGLVKVCGDIGARDNEVSQDEETGDISKDIVSFLTFKAWSHSPKAVPLELVSRLEEIDASNIEWSGNKRVIQYRDKLMHLIMFNPSAEIPTEGLVEVIVFVDEDRIMGLVVEEILDIAKQEMHMLAASSDAGLLGSMVFDAQTTDLIDISHLFSRTFEDWLGSNEAQAVVDGKNVANEVRNILLVDDSPFFRKFMKPVLVVAGYNVTTADGAGKALELLRDPKMLFDLVVTDIDMPEMTGIEFVQVCKQDTELAMMPFVALTSHDEKDFGGDASQYGFEAFITKSDREKLVAVIGQILTGASLAA